MDTIGDFLTIIRNASRAGKPSCNAQWSKVRLGIARILRNEGYIRSFKELKDEKGFQILQIVLKYIDETSAINQIERVSKPGCRIYYGYRDIPRVLGGLGVLMVSTPKGIFKDTDARREKLGGELLCRVS